VQIVKSQDAKKAFVAGLSWQVLDPMEDRFWGHAQIPKLLEEGGRYFVRYKNAGEVNMGVLKSLDDIELADKKTFSFAGLVATHPAFRAKTCLVLVSDSAGDESRVMAVGLVVGNVVTDRALDLGGLQTVYEEFVDLCAKSGRSFFVAGDVSPSGVEVKPSHRLTCAQLLGNKSAKKLKLEVLKDERLALTLVGAVLGFIVLACCIEAWSWYHGEKLAALEQHKQAQNSPEAIYAQSVRLIQGQKFLIPGLSGAQFFSAVGSFPAQLGGWQVTQISCEALQCTAKWRSVGGTYESFKQAAPPDWGKLDLVGGEKNALGDLQSLQHGFKLEVPMHALPPKSQWPKAESYMLAQGVEWQKLKDYAWRATLGGLEQQGIPPTMHPATVRSHPEALFGMPWSVDKQNWELGKWVLPIFKPHITLKNFELMLDPQRGAAVFSANGVAYVNP
jgi:hypothetical protein